MLELLEMVWHKICFLHELFSFIYLSPLAVESQYPSTLILTADHDDRVSPLHSLKFIAALHNEIETCESQRNPLLLRVYSKAGHGAGKPTTKKIEESTDILTFMYKALNLKMVKNWAENTAVTEEGDIVICIV